MNIQLRVGYFEKYPPFLIRIRHPLFTDTMKKDITMQSSFRILPFLEGML